MKKVKKKNKYNLFSLSIVIGLSLIVILGILIAISFIGINNSLYFARIRVAAKKKVQIVYNQNLFDGSKINNSGIKEYDSDKQEITFDGKLEGNYINLGTLNVKLKKGERYRVTVNYLSGSYDKNGEPKFIFELQKDNEYYKDRKNGTHYIFEMLPTKKDKPIDKVLTIKDEVLDATNIIYRIYQENEVEFNNYKIQISITKLESKIGVAGDKYGSLPTPEKDGYEFLGWYDSISGGKKITETNTILKKYNHQLYAHWENNIYVDYGPCKIVLKSIKVNNDNRKYGICVPEQYNGQKLPLIFFLHGMNGDPNSPFYTNFYTWSNADYNGVINNWSKYGLKNIPAIIVMPWIQFKDKWNNKYEYSFVDGVYNEVINNYNIDKNNVCLMGHSIGGQGVFTISARFPTYFKSIVAMSALITKPGAGDIEYFANMPMKGFAEKYNPKTHSEYYNYEKKMTELFNNIRHQNDFRVVPVTHGAVPEYALTTDENGDGISDLIYWALFQTKK